MEVINTLQDEHLGVLSVLDHLDQAANAAERGRPVPADVFADIQEFFSVFVDRCHHGKEETAVFPRLLATGAADLVRRLEADHTTGRGLAAAYGDAVRRYVPGDMTAGGRLASAARAYAAFLRSHIDSEVNELFPAIDRALANEDQDLAAAFEHIEVEKIGAGTHERLHEMIGGLGARIGPWL